MKENKKKVIFFLKEPEEIRLPIYQRNATAWTEEQLEKLIDDIIKSNETGKKNNLLAVYYQMIEDEKDEIPFMLLVDGQQRTTNMSLLIACIAEFKKNNPQVNFGKTKEGLMDYYLFKTGNKTPKLKLKFNDELSYKKILDIVSSDIPATYKNLPNHKLSDNFLTLQKFINEDNVIELWEGIKNTYFNPIELDEDDDPNQIFNSINLNFGTSLHLDEQLFNHIYKLLEYDVDKATMLAEHYWEPMARRYEDVYYKKRPLFDIFVRTFLSVNDLIMPTPFKSLYDKMCDFLNSSEDICETVISFCELGHHFIDIYTLSTDSPIINEKFQHLKYFGFDWIICGFKIYNDYIKGIINLNELLSILDTLESYVFRLKMSIHTKNLSAMIPALLKVIKNLDETNYIASFNYLLLNIKGKGQFYNDNDVCLSFSHLNFYEACRGDLFKYVWCKLNSLLNPKEIPKMTDITQHDHINAQQPTSKTRERWGDLFNVYYERDNNLIGNLTATGYNQEFGNKDYIDKMERYSQSNFQCNRELVKEYPEMTHKDIVKRTNILAKRCCEIWSMPTNKEFKLERYSDINPYNKANKQKL